MTERAAAHCPSCERKLRYHLVPGQSKQVPYEHCGHPECDFRSCIGCLIIVDRVTGHWVHSADWFAIHGQA